ncbi:MAG: YdbH domain-containing protein, partial [Alphaproteobacteria bacterium]|nr:YdbH domain-containing protein [Alphaproteobacteria bacterium]
GVIIIALLATLTMAYLARRALAREALVAWLDARGVEAEADFQAIGPRGLVGALRIGPADAPILTAKRAEVGYRITGPWAGRGFGVELDQVELFSPTISVQLTPEGPSLGALDALIEEFRNRPTQPGAAAPDIIVHDGLIQLAHAGGQARLHADARMIEGVLVSLSGRLEPTRVALDGLSLDLAEARLGLVTRDGRASASLAGGLKSGRMGDISVDRGVLSLALNAPYPDGRTPLGEGPITAVATLTASSLRRDGVAAGTVDVSGSFRGQASGGLAALALQGAGTLRADVDEGRVGELRVDALSASAQSEDIIWRRGDGVSGDLRLSLIGQQVTTDDLVLKRLAADLTGQMARENGTLTATLDGPVRLSGGWSGLGPVRADDVETLAAIKRAAQAFSVSAPALRLAHGQAGFRVGLAAPAVLRSVSGGRLTLAPRATEPLYADGGGAFDLRIEDGGLPTVAAEIPGYHLAPGAVRARTSLSVETDFGPMEGVAAAVGGDLTIAGGELSLRVDSCAPIRMDRFEAGDTSVEDIRLALCPGPSPLVVVKDGQWRISGRANGVSAQAPFLQASLQNGVADLVFGAEPSGLYADVSVMDGQLIDLADSPRFNPLEVAGDVNLAADIWRGDLTLASDGRAVADVDLAHDGATGVGAVDVDTGRLVFAEDSLQPIDLSPLAAAVGSPALGSAQFTGEFRWGPKGGRSGGQLTVFELDFASPAGAVRGLSGDLLFTSLAPLETAPGQQLTAQQLQLLAPLATPRVTFQLLGQSLEIAGGAVKVGGGTVSVEPMSVPFDGAEAWRGELVVDGVQLADIVEATPFADRVSLSARVSGRLPFIVGPDGFRLVQGRLAAIEPGRLSIRRAALTDVSATGGDASAAVEALGEAATVAPAEETNTAVEFAYQAMEHLAFDLLDAEVNSLPGGRLGVLFHVRGEHSPPQRQEIRLTLGELIRRDFLNRELPLPSGTKVDLTLDTSLNLDQLLADYAQAQAARGSGEVQTPDPQ